MFIISLNNLFIWYIPLCNFESHKAKRWADPTGIHQITDFLTGIVVLRKIYWILVSIYSIERKKLMLNNYLATKCFSIVNTRKWKCFSQNVDRGQLKHSKILDFFDLYNRKSQWTVTALYYNNNIYSNIQDFMLHNT